MYSKLKKLKSHHQILWSLIIATALVSIWRGIWRLMDTLIFPNNFVISSISSVVLGVLLLIITHYRLK